MTTSKTFYLLCVCFQLFELKLGFKVRMYLKANLILWGNMLTSNYRDQCLTGLTKQAQFYFAYVLNLKGLDPAE